MSLVFSLFFTLNLTGQIPTCAAALIEQLKSQAQAFEQFDLTEPVPVIPGVENIVKLILPHPKNPYRLQLGKRANTPGIFYPGQWELLGGRVNPGESIQEAAAREPQEEVSAKLHDLKLIDVVLLYDPQLKKVCRIFVLQARLGRMGKKEFRKVDQVKYRDVRRLPANTIPSVRDYLKHIYLPKLARRPLVADTP
jgi:8-oxo-dGTP pyrophosphatase MutT (NUDIX family)